MEAPKLQDAVIEIDGEGTLHGDDAVLSQLKNQQFRLRVLDRGITLEPLRRHLSEIENAAERMRAFQAFKMGLREVVPGTSGTLPDDWATIRDSIYD